jgi:hypothetical protein
MSGGSVVPGDPGTLRNSAHDWRSTRHPDLDLDLPVALVPLGTRATGATGGRSVWLVAGLVLLGFAAGIAVRDRVEEPADPVGNMLSATVSLREVLLAPAASAVLVVEIQNRDDVRRVADGVRVAGPGTIGTSVPISVDLPPNGQGLVPVTVALSCTSAPPQQPDLAVEIRLRTATSARALTIRDLVALPVGRLAQSGGLCAAADATFPLGWRAMVRPTTWDPTGDHVHVVALGLPPEASLLAQVQTNGIPLEILAATVGSDHSLDLSVRPGVTCTAQTPHPIVLTGLELLLLGPDGMVQAYLPLGPAFADWMMEAFVRACPAHPDGPSSVRLDFAG